LRRNTKPVFQKRRKTKTKPFFLNKKQKLFFGKTIKKEKKQKKTLS